MLDVSYAADMLLRSKGPCQFTLVQRYNVTGAGGGTAVSRSPSVVASDVDCIARERGASRPDTQFVAQSIEAKRTQESAAVMAAPGFGSSQAPSLLAAAAVILTKADRQNNKKRQVTEESESFR